MKSYERQPDEHESRAAVALTVAWMLTCMSTAVGMFVVLAMRLLIIAFPVAGGNVHPLDRVGSVLLFVAITTGFLCLVFTPLVYRVRLTPPPRTVTIGAVAIGLSPIALSIVLMILRSQ